MEENKKNILKNKNFIIIAIVVVAVTAVILLLLNSKEKEKIMECNLSIDTPFYESLNVDMTAYYTKKNINRLYGNIDVTLSDNLISSFDNVYATMEQQYSKFNIVDCVDISLAKDIIGHKIMLNYDIDYLKCDLDDTKKLQEISFFNDKSEASDISINKFIEEMEQAGGVCNEK